MGDRKNNTAKNGCSRKKRILAAVLAVCLAVTVTLAPARAASVGATVSIAGGAVGTAGIASGAAVGSLALPVLGIVGLVLLGTGINVALTNASQEAGMTKTDYIQSKLSEFAQARGQDVNNLINLMSNHLAVMSDGNVIVGQEAGQVIQQFGNWLFQENEVFDVNTSNSGTATLNGISSFYGDSITVNGTNIGSYQLFSDSSFYLVGQILPSNPDHVQVIAIAESSIIVHGKLPESTYISDYRMYRAGNYYSAQVCSGSYSGISTNSDIVILSYAEYQDLISGTGAITGDSAIPNEDVFTGKEQDWTDNKDLLIPGEGEATILSGPDVINPAATAVGTGDWTISVPDYLDALARAYNKGLDAATGAGDVSVSLTDTATGAKTSTAVNIAAASPVIQVDTYPRPGTGSGLPLTDPGLLPDPGDVFNLPAGWERKFPFSAFDNVNSILSMLGTSPVTPYYHFHWEYEFNDRPIVVDFEVDLSYFNELANYFRMLFRILWLFAIAKRTWAIADPALRGE